MITVIIGLIATKYSGLVGQLVDKYIYKYIQPRYKLDIKIGGKMQATQAMIIL